MFAKTLAGWPGHLMAAAAGALITLSLAPYNLWPLGLASVALLAYLLNDLKPAQTALRAWFYGVGMFGSGTSWVYVSIHNFGNASVELASFLTALFSMGLGLFFAIPLYCYGRFIRELPGGKLLGFAAMWGLTEWFRSWMLTGFPWLYVGYGHLQTPLAGWAPVIGTLGIGAIIALTGAYLSEAIRERSIKPIALTAILALWIAGPLLNRIEWVSPAEKAPIKIAMVQANIPQSIKWDRDQYWPTLQLYRSMSEPLWAEHDIVIWPEAAIPGFYRSARPFLDEMSEVASRNGSSLVTGMPTGETTEDGRRIAYNSIMVFGEGDGLYHKQRLVPFGEYVPLEGLLRGLIDFFDLPMSAFSAGGADQPLLNANGVSLSPSICYEVVYGDLVASQASETDMLLTISNDAWFGDSIGPLQHMEMAQMRALENGRYMIRSTGNGITAIVDERGRILKRSAQFKREVLSGEARIMQGSTPFAATGSMPVVLGCLLVCAGLLINRQRRIKNPA